MTGQYRVLCPEGDFAVESDDKDELVNVVQDHAERKHSRELGDDKIHELIENEEQSEGIE